MIIIIDSGSTRSRLYLMQGETRVATSVVACGVSSGDTTHKAVFRQAIAEGITDLLNTCQLQLSDIRFAIASGMITSNLGLMEIPHIAAPVSVEQLVRHTVEVKDPDILPLDLEIRFIPGIKNSLSDGGWSCLCDIDLMRGEETQAVGVMISQGIAPPLTIVELGSTTKLIHIDAQGRIAGSLTSLSGQVYGAVKSGTFIGSSMQSEDDVDLFSADILQRACDSVRHAGLLRSLLFTRFLEFSIPTTAAERTFFCQAVLAADDMKLFDEANRLGFSLDGNIVLVGKPQRCEIYRHLLASQAHVGKSIHIISDKEDIAQLAIQGAGYIAERMSLENT